MTDYALGPEKVEIKPPYAVAWFHKQYMLERPFEKETGKITEFDDLDKAKGHAIRYMPRDADRAYISVKIQMSDGQEMEHFALQFMRGADPVEGWKNVG